MKKAIFTSLLLVLLNLPSLAGEADCVSAVCEAWSNDAALDTVNLPNTAANPIEIHFLDEIDYSTRWADTGFQRSVEVKANAEGVSEQDLFSTDVNGLEGTFCWKYCNTDPAVLPREKVYTVTHTINDTTNGVTYVVDTETVYVTLSTDIRVDATWSDSFELDNVSVLGPTLELDTPAKITYSTDWIVGYERNVKIQITEKESSEPGIFSASVEPYTLFTSSGEDQGDYSWDYSGVDPAVLPRNASYSLTYTVYNGDTVFGSENASATINLVPEPGVFFFFALAMLLIKRVK